jgi:hypothetical protein
MEGRRPQGYPVTSAVLKVTMMGHPVECVVLQYRSILRRLISYSGISTILWVGGSYLQSRSESCDSSVWSWKPQGLHWDTLRLNGKKAREFDRPFLQLMLKFKHVKDRLHAKICLYAVQIGNDFVFSLYIGLFNVYEVWLLPLPSMGLELAVTRRLM